MKLCRTSGAGLDATAKLYGLERKIYLWGLLVETDKRLRKRIMGYLRGAPFSVVDGRPLGLDVDAVAKSFGMRRRWLERRSTFVRRVIDRMHRGKHVGISVGYTVRKP